MCAVETVRRRRPREEVQIIQIEGGQRLCGDARAVACSPRGDASCDTECDTEWKTNGR